MTNWLIKEISIEGVRGVNNENDPLILKLKPNAINSISAQNGVGKSSIFDAISVCIRGQIPKLEALPSSENPRGYYLNLFHSANTGSIQITLEEENGGINIPITVSLTEAGERNITAPAGYVGEDILNSLNREFVLLDYRNFQLFIDETTVNRGRSFAKLLGLGEYSNFLQGLKTISNTRAFKSKFDLGALEERLNRAQQDMVSLNSETKKEYEKLTGNTDFESRPKEEILDVAQLGLSQIPVIQSQCVGLEFTSIDIDLCLEAVGNAEGGEDRERLSEIIRLKEIIHDSLKKQPSSDSYEKILEISSNRDLLVSEVGGELLRDLYQVSKSVLERDDWENKRLCPTCDEISEESVLSEVVAKLSKFEVVNSLTESFTAIWEQDDWSNLTTLEQLVRPPTLSTKKLLAMIEKAESLALTEIELRDLWRLKSEIAESLEGKIELLKIEQLALEKTLPPSLVEVTKTLETARRLQNNWLNYSSATEKLNALNAEKTRYDRVKHLLDNAHEIFGEATSDAEARRLNGVEPLCREYFEIIMGSGITPNLKKAINREGLLLSLSNFWTLSDLSAQALLSESYRNALAISTYLAAAKMYGSEARFLVLDDITSSFDAGHQFQLMELLRLKFARPIVVDGPQVILLSHDTLLEKLFNKNSQGTDWHHQRLEGTAQTAILPQSGSANRVRDTLVDFLNAGRVHDGAPRLRQYLEYKLLEVIQKVKIPVPIDFALDDNKKMPQNSLDAILGAVAVNKAANRLKLSSAQEAGLQTHVATITGNYLSHYTTGSTGAFSAASLLNVVRAIDEFTDCFKEEQPVGSGNFKYYSRLW